MKHLLSGLIGVCLLAGPAYAKDYTWEITTRMEMAGMPPGMGSQKHTSCIGEGKEAEPESKSECKILDRSMSGKITRMTMKCKEGTMKVEHEQLTPEHWRSKMQMTTDGEEMTVRSEGRRLGTCDLAKDGRMSKETQAQLGASAQQAKAHADQLGKDCQRAVDQWPGATNTFTTYDHMVKARQDVLANAGKGPDGQRMADASSPEVPGCAKAKPLYCSKTKAAYGEMSSRKGYADVMRRAKPASGVDAALAYCGAGNSAALRSGHCKAAVSDADYGFVAAYCPEERKILARQHCAGRAYTAIEAKYRALCGGGSYESAGSTSASRQSEPTAAADGEPDPVQDGVKQGVKAIKGLFDF
ncbi:MAG TPA: DUF3617 family protein [Burkholderiales bacterium]|nr:DUF3617 family protein [Burkholderiales bacterium]